MCNVSVFSIQGAEGLEKVLATATLVPVPWGWEVEGQTAFWTWSPVTQSVLYQLSFSQCFHGCRRFLWCYWMFFISFGTCILSCLHFIGSNTFLIILYVRIPWLLPPIQHFPPAQSIDSKTISWTSPCSGAMDKFHPFLVVFSWLLLGLVWPILPVCIIL